MPATGPAATGRGELAAPDGTATFTHRATGRTHTTLPRSRRELHPPGHPAGAAPGQASERVPP